MNTIESLAHDARMYIRDPARWFTATVAREDSSRTFSLPHQNVSPWRLRVWATNGTNSFEGKTDGDASDVDFLYQLDSRNGLLRVLSPPLNGGFGTGSWINTEGYYYDWVAPEDLLFFTTNVIAEHQYHRPEFNLDALDDVEAGAIALGAAVESLWSLLAEYSRDIDISTPEAMSIPATQRYHQLEDLLFSPRGLVEKYKTKAAMLNVGLERIEQYQLRRRSYTTGRLVPVYKSREWDDASTPTRLFPPNPTELPTTPPADFKPARVVTGFAEYPEPYTGEVP